MFRMDDFNKMKRNPSQFDEENRNKILRREFLIYSNLLFLYFFHLLIRKRYGDYTPKVVNKLLNNQLDDRVQQLFDYIVAVLEFSERITAERNLPRYLKNIQNISLLYREVEKEIEKDKARRKDILEETFPN